MSVNWKESQLRVIEEKEGEIIVSASAGSGKTTVMIERLIRLIESGVSVDRVLCLTFTESAAREIKERLSKALCDRLEGADEESKKRIISQLDRLPFADLSTIDAFCKRLVKRYFEKVDVDPAFSVAGEDESNSIKYRSAERALSLFAERGDEVYFELVDFLGKKRSEESLIKAVIDIDEYLSCIEDREGFVERAIKEAGEDFESSYVFVKEASKASVMLRLIEEIAIPALSYDLPYPEEVLSWVKRVKKALFTSPKAFFEEASKDIPEHPKYNRKPYSSKKESMQDMAFLRKKVESFTSAFSGYDYEIEKNGREVRRCYADKLFEIVSVFRKEYERSLEASSLIDFAGIERKALSCLEDEEIRRETASRYTHVLVDEYQDTNKLQDRIISACSGGKSLFMVGDAKQSIYEFRHADPDLFVSKKKKEGIKAHSLKENFRTDDKVIDGVNELFLSVYNENSAGEEYLGQEMEAQREGLDVGYPPVSCNVFFTKSSKKERYLDSLYSVAKAEKEEEEDEEKEETVFVCNKIAELLKNGVIKDKNGEERAIKSGDIAVLSRSRSGYTNIVKRLRASGYPVAVSEKHSLPYSAELLVHLLRVLDNTQREDSLVTIMLSPLFAFSENELASFRIRSGKKIGLFECLLRERSSSAKLNDFLTKIEDYKFRSGYYSVADLLDYIVRDTELELILGAEEDGEGELGVLSAYLDSLRGSTIAQSVTDYLNYFDKYPYFETQKVSGAEDGVKVMTIHASKGLEFPVVFLVGTGTHFIKDDAKKSVLLHKKYGVAMPSFDLASRVYKSNFALDAIKRKMGEDTIAQELRLLYVALTRARNLLFVSGTSRSSSDKEFYLKTEEQDAKCLLDFFLVAKNKNSLVSKKICYTYMNEQTKEPEIAIKEKKLSVNEELVHEARELLDTVYLHQKSTVTPSKFTVTALVKESAMDDTPTIYLTRGESAEAGTLYHRVMEHIDLSIKEEGELDEALDKMLLDGVLDQKERDSLNKKILLRALNQSVIKEISTKKHKKEQAFLLRALHSELVEGGIEDEVLLQGVIDLLAEGDEPIIVDYKYSSRPSCELKAYYGEQIRLYRLATSKILKKDKIRCYLLSLKTGELIDFND